MMDQLVRAALVMGSLALTACSSSSDSAASALDGSVSETGGASAGGFAGNGGGRGGVGASPSGTGGSSGLGGSAGGSSGLGGSAGGSAGSGGSNTGGVAFGSGGLCGCQCAPNAIRLQVSARGSDGGTGVLGSLTVKGSGVDMQCLRSGCTFVCTSTQSTLADGDYSVSIGAPGYRSQTVQIHVTTSCGCCGCCAISTPSSVEILPDGSPITGCCSDLTNDPSNCGACGKTCPAEAWCARSACTPLFSPCTGANSGFSGCTAYCKSIGKSCSAACGPSGTESIEWWGQSSINCGDNVYSSNGTCDDNLLGYGARCCCTG